MADMLFLNVPFHEKNQAKALGACWSPRRRQWFVPTEVDPSLFRRWIPRTACGPNATLFAPVYLFRSQAPCWKCSAVPPVFTLAAEGFQHHESSSRDNTFVVLAWIRWLAPPLEQWITQRCPSYYPDWSETAQLWYFMNHCPCGARLGDFHLHGEPGGGFFPVEPDECGNMTLITLPPLSELTVAGSYGQSTFDYKTHLRRE